MATVNYFTQFTLYLSTEKRYSNHTVKAYTDDLIQFTDFLEITYGITNTLVVKSIYIRTWLSQLKEDGISSKTINRKISTLKTYYKFLQRQADITNSPLLNITAPKIAKRLPQFVEQKDIQTLLQHIDFEEGYKGVLHKTVIAIFYFTGMRLNELVTLKLNDVNFANHTLKVLGKGNKERVLPIVETLAFYLKDYVEARSKLETILETATLLLNSKGKSLYAKYVYNVVHQYLGNVTTISKKSPHILRHSFATHLTNNGASINAVKDLLGHASLAATQIYTHNNIDKLKNAHKKAHPKG